MRALRHPINVALALSVAGGCAAPPPPPAGGLTESWASAIRDSADDLQAIRATSRRTVGLPRRTIPNAFLFCENDLRYRSSAAIVRPSLRAQRTRIQTQYRD